jgi:PAS domain S-box-containing protein
MRLIRGRQRTLRASEERFRTLVENTSDGILVLDGQGRIAYVTPPGARILGYPAEEVIGRDGLEFVYPEDRRIAEEAARGCREKPGAAVPAGFRVSHRDGWWRNLEAVAVNRLSDPAVGGVVVNFRDVTERDRMEQALHDSEQFNREIVSNAGEGIVVSDRSLRCLVWNRFMETLTGIPARDVIGRSLLETFSRLRGQGFERLMARALDGETVSVDLELHFSDSGKSGWISNTCSPHRNAQGEIVGVIGIVRDISERRRSEEAVRENERRFRAVFEELQRSERKLREAQAIGGIGVWERDLRDDSIIWSEEMYKFFDLDPKSFRPTLEGIVERVLPRDRLTIRQERDTAVRERRPSRQEFRILRADGSVAVIQSRGEVVLDEKGEPVRMVGVAHDITEQRKAEERLRRSNRELRALWARLGAVREEEATRIARAVHDEVGQALTALKLDLSWVQKRLARRAVGEDLALEPKLETMVALIDTTLDAVHRISTELRPGVLHELGLEAAIDWYAQEFQKRTEIACRLRSALDDAEVDSQRSTAAFRIFQEILTNVARHAAATEVEVFLGTEKGDLVLEANDNGRGIPEERISDSRCLGLLGMRERARSFGGNVAIRAAAGGGTAVSVRIPL